VDAVMFSGDKLLGGPQAGIIVGADETIAQVRRHPLMRAMRADKMTYAALEATLEEYAAGRAVETIPVTRMLGMRTEEIGTRANALAATLGTRGVSATVIDGYSTIGGGSAPGSALPTRLVAITHPGTGPDALEARLRDGDPPLIARIETDRLVLDLRTVPPEMDAALADVIAAAWRNEC
jgi:L-seryl-tRNA(Ser) seleniumtransferase